MERFFDIYFAQKLIPGMRDMSGHIFRCGSSHLCPRGWKGYAEVVSVQDNHKVHVMLEGVYRQQMHFPGKLFLGDVRMT